ncbi:MAG: hypothetical protein ABJN84_13565 [Flavobacteriaceae bacterium]
MSIPKISTQQKKAFNHCLAHLYEYYRTFGTPYDFIAHAMLREFLEKAYINQIEVTEFDEVDISPSNPHKLNR